MPRTVTITHPKLGTSQVLESSLRVWEERGWKVEEKADTESKSGSKPAEHKPAAKKS